MTGMNIDITARKAAEEALRELAEARGGLGPDLRPTGRGPQGHDELPRHRTPVHDSTA
jgi:hypothetical protein